VSQISTAREYLQQQIESHGNMILNRWKKRTQQQREALLLQAYPGLAQEKWFCARFNYAGGMGM
jgi:hypothetical protein